MSTVSEGELEHWFEQGMQSYTNESRFFACLIRAMVYAYVPVSDDSKNVRLIQFRHPDGYDAIPFFTSAHRAARSTFSGLRTIKLPCTTLFEMTRGATLMVNPNDGGAVLFPEEVATLLRSGTLETFEKVSLSEGPVDIRPATSAPDNLIKALDGNVPLPLFIREVYLLEKRTLDGDLSRPSLLIYAGVETRHMERGARHLVSVVHALDPRPEDIVDVAVFDIAQARPGFLNDIGAIPVFASGP